MSDGLCFSHALRILKKGDVLVHAKVTSTKQPAAEAAPTPTEIPVP